MSIFSCMVPVQISSARDAVLSGKYACVSGGNGATGGLVIVEIAP